MREKGAEGPDEGARLAAMRRQLEESTGLTRREIHKQTGITPTTQRTLEETGRGYRLPAYRRFLEDVTRDAETSDTADTSKSVQTFIEASSSPGSKPLALVFHEFAALLGKLPPEHRTPAVRTFVRTQQRLDDGTVDAVKTLEAAAEIVVDAFSQFVVRHGRSE